MSLPLCPLKKFSATFKLIIHNNIVCFLICVLGLGKRSVKGIFFFFQEEPQVYLCYMTLEGKICPLSYSAKIVQTAFNCIQYLVLKLQWYSFLCRCRLCALGRPPSILCLAGSLQNMSLLLIFYPKGEIFDIKDSNNIEFNQVDVKFDFLSWDWVAMESNVPT